MNSITLDIRASKATGEVSDEEDEDAEVVVVELADSTVAVTGLLPGTAF